MQRQSRLRRLAAPNSETGCRLGRSNIIWEKLNFSDDECFLVRSFPARHYLSGDSVIFINDRVGPDDEFETIMKPGSCRMVDSFHFKNCVSSPKKAVGSIT